jgi:hypothetical protein
MFKAIKEFLFGKPAAAPTEEESKVEAVNAAPYKVEPPVLTEVVAAPVKKTVAAPKAKAAPAKKAPAKKPAAAKAPAKKALAKAGDKKPAKKAPAKKTK